MTTRRLVRLGAIGTAAALLAGIIVIAGPVRPEASQSDGGVDNVKRLHALFDAEWERTMRENPTWASQLGDRRYNNRWEDRSLTAIENSHANDIGVLRALEAIDRSRLPAPEQLNYDLFLQHYRDRVEGHRFRTFLMPIDQLRHGVQAADQLRDSLRFQTEKDYQDWIARLRALGTYVDQTIALLEMGIAEGRTQPRVIMERIPDQIAVQIVVDPAASPFYIPFETMSADVAPEAQEQLRTEAREAITDTVVPAFRRLEKFFVERYLPAARTAVGARDLPDGDAYYAFRTRTETTTGKTPEEIHQLGLKEVARIRAEMEALIDKVGFQGSFGEFLDFLRTDQRFYYRDAQELLDAYRAITRRIDPELVKLFGRLPRLPYGVTAIPDTSAADANTAYYLEGASDGSRAGAVFVNLHKPEVRPKYQMDALMAHEGVPGHHLQIALAMELDELPDFRRHGHYTAYVEGWALYSERLGEELGLYQDPYSKFGALSYEMLRAARLVVDTGLHAKHWTRQQAIDYFRQHVADSEHEIVTEIDRYIARPGQALAYKIGELEITELRQRAEERLGERFDVKAFHDTVLASGAVPLDVLESNVEEWIQRVLGAAGRKSAFSR
jgi:uncharacterized protein (DUF885 family)